ncbi:hypothetical protein O181_000189 [Austropuccinia psidii MF-1]|uniref:Uncharacterized protein n=1 Tax=Austropuccinia psidii MF-1 TaxID=1389203 RepID=A0A9Q3B843_9BASI|nr:hypothetical protein [Austropuccinia psidii MF-1]
MPRNKPKGRTELFISRRSVFGQNSEWQDTEAVDTHTTIHLPIQQRPQTRGLNRNVSSTSAPPTPQRPVSVEHETHEVQPVFQLGGTRGNLTEDMSQRDVF